MYRIHSLLAATGLLLVGCAETSTPTAQSPSAEPTTVTVNKPLLGEDALEPGQTEEAPAPDESLLPPADVSEENAAEHALKELGEAGDAVSDWAAESKDKLVEQAEQRLTDLDEDIAKLVTRAQDLTGEAKTRWEQDKQLLEEKRSEFSQELDTLKASGDEAWKEMAAGISKAWTELKQASKAAAAEFE